MGNPRIAIGALLVALVAGLALYSTLRTPEPHNPAFPPGSAAPPARPAPPPGTGTPPRGPAPIDSAPSPSAPEGAATAAARRLLELLPKDDCTQLTRFADEQADKLRTAPGAQPLVNALESAQQYCYQRERLPELARERRAEAERLAQQFLGEKPARPSGLP